MAKGKNKNSDATASPQIRRQESLGAPRYAFNAREKRWFLSALQENGISIIYDLKKLAEYIPDRSDNELRSIIDSYVRRAHSEQSSENHLDSKSTLENMEEWCRIISSCVPFPAKRDDLSNCLSEIVSRRAEEIDELSNHDDDDNEDDESQEIDYKAVYNFFADVMSGRYPAELPERESLLVVTTIDNLLEMVENLDTSDENNFLKKSPWWQSDQESNPNNGTELASTSDVSHDSSDSTSIPSVPIAIPDENHQNGGQNMAETSQSSTFFSSQLNDRLQKVLNCRDPTSLESYYDLPRIRKIRECFNPLKVPTDLLKKEHDIVSCFFE
ncbi:uncharacterized protein LOC141855537 [Brevipalpus obovatus]|uniref:uncharacterized protein LOC141855537 n=1 Tax=Brevipalpus obovatus TaxID=246614 RepID=UPI003D9F3697